MLRRRWVTGLCLILWALAHIFGAVSITFFMDALYEPVSLSDLNLNTIAGQSLSLRTLIRYSDAVTHNSLVWGLAAGLVSLLFALSGCGLWKMKKWGFISCAFLILAFLPGILAWLGLDLRALV